MGDVVVWKLLGYVEGWLQPIRGHWVEAAGDNLSAPSRDNCVSVGGRDPSWGLLGGGGASTGNLDEGDVLGVWRVLEGEMWWMGEEKGRVLWRT